MKKIRRADIVLLLSEMEAKGSDKLIRMRRQYMNGEITLRTLTDATEKHLMLHTMLEIFQTCQLELDDLLEMLNGMKGQGRGQASLFRQPKNPM